jgi:predicted 2-oxoglutarate/Fe(II)-dependent dioxygenase YbiX
MSTVENAGRLLGWGEPAPWFEARSNINPQFVFSSLAGRFVALTFFGRSSEPRARTFLEAVAVADLPRNDGERVSYGVSTLETDLADSLACRAFPPQRIFHDPDMQIAARFGLTSTEASALRFEPRWFVLDPTLRVYASGNLDAPEQFLNTLRQLPNRDEHAGTGTEIWAPVLLIPRVLEREFCRTLIASYENGQPEPSGFMRNAEGKTVSQVDSSFKRRSDLVIQDERLRMELQNALRLRIIPEIKKVFQFNVTRIERYIVACYDSHSGGFFKAHRDNTTAGTAHRRFAVTINLNAEDYEGGELRFPEYGPKHYRAPTGGAVVFSCSLLHEATPVTRGVRYATLPFLYDDEAARLREANNKFLDSSVRPYRGDAPARPIAAAAPQKGAHRPAPQRGR